MSTSLTTSLLDPARQPAVVADFASVVDAEVKDKSGLSGTAIKAAYGAVKKVSPSVIESALTKLLPEFASALDLFWADFQAQGPGDFGQYLASRGDEVGDALLSVTDQRAESTSQPALRKAYGSLRGKAKENVVAALPRVGAVVQKNAA
ncbi:putative protein OS=Tsukamurella paurometabola (strain ATCC 8368 / DSM / CCUG 35730 /CIP 100753 / JCM 10117 / KCTC 9821 / NBRC 16120 / NCIMB 702349/ NCTC 13040) OX=521096 GN=Tpau_4053 PE=4 SV=1 [Tsukamurella paurometabola]|uniref:Uncharacterized protein n=1 Tax=Tsukamurella paurometabola (strain ATCC 8368 / DSM 20162 / CCUG 35730 / CIP 100753 / JCM 10117 / KCTC 9821 / NBRC 16120 / NCIMB 702349 / NCTC 13040) TaxID=521096 RepID=D5UNC9_TSUPD|nr:hypothetical protein [Tsukamurella paurometabola]ADG80624.1 conserved hypothetical protein [Tsukamurella paurometabola DSM 20162]SUP40329.1 Uncharacterised protein [Tsukamurella paurometabola]